ncbi:MAG: hypothetical protein J6S26_01345 [Solobacterium sp.]|nr:hypothetical protein [Solobacterium sp.]
MRRKLFSQNGAGFGRFLIGVLIVAVIAAIFLAAASFDGFFHIPQSDGISRLLQELSVILQNAFRAVQELISGIGR